MAAAASAVPASEHEAATSATGPQVVLVTGGTGLVGQGIRTFVEGAGAKDAPEGETWYYASSKDGDLRCVQTLGPLLGVAGAALFPGKRARQLQSSILNARLCRLARAGRRTTREHFSSV